jgi:hypothetical protein
LSAWLLPALRSQELAERQAAKLVHGPKQQQQESHFGSVQELARTIGASDFDDPCHCVSMCDCGTCQLCVLRAYASHPWNINNIPQAKGSVLRFVREDVGGKPITGGCRHRAGWLGGWVAERYWVAEQ